MNTTTRFLTGSLASLAVASAVTLAAPSADAADEPGRPCGQPAIPAVSSTLFHEPELRVVPAVTHDEWRWQREVTSYEFEYSKVVSPAHRESDWTRELPGRPSTSGRTRSSTGPPFPPRPSRDTTRSWW